LENILDLDFWAWKIWIGIWDLDLAWGNWIFALGYLGTYSCIDISLFSFFMAWIKDSCLCLGYGINWIVWHGMESWGSENGIGLDYCWHGFARRECGMDKVFFFSLRVFLIGSPRSFFDSTFGLDYHGPVLHSVITKLVGFGLLQVSFMCI
jgi:hypothetical protein